MDDYSKIANLPAAAPPPGVVANFDNPPSRAHELYIGMGICITVAAILLALRMYAKSVVTHSPGWDDMACSIGFVLYVLYVAMVFASTTPHGPFARPEWDNKVGQLGKAFEQKTLALLTFFSAAAFFIRLSLFLLYLRLFKPNRYTCWLVYGGIIACGLFYTASIVANCVIMMPTPGQGNDNMAWLLRESTIEDKLWVIQIVLSVFGLLSEIYLLVIPLQMIFQLHFSLGRKIGVSSVFMVGILAIACSVAGLMYRVKSLEGREDDNWTGVLTHIFAQVHLNYEKFL